MKTKFILSGGYADHLNKTNNKFFQEILKTEKKELKILLVLFAKEKEEWKKKEEDTNSQFELNKGEKKLVYEVADEENFVRQCQKADVIYLHGGQPLKLLNTLKKFENLGELFKGKIIAGESAGAYVLSACFYSKTEAIVFEGLGFVPVKTICHYDGKNREKLEECSEQLEELLLPDYEFKVFYRQ